MNIKLLLFVTSLSGEASRSEVLVKSVESHFRPCVGDVIDDPGFHPGFHNGYEVAKVTLNYALNECWVSLTPMVMDREEIEVETYMDKLQTNGWQVVPNEELRS